MSILRPIVRSGTHQFQCLQFRLYPCHHCTLLHKKYYHKSKHTFSDFRSPGFGCASRRIVAQPHDCQVIGGTCGEFLSWNSNSPDRINFSVIRTLCLSFPHSQKSSSKVEETVKRLKDKQEEQLHQLSKVQDLEKRVEAVLEDDAARQAELRAESSTAAPRKSLWVRFVEEVKHYYTGFKLLFVDIKIASFLVWRIVNGRHLTRRENKQLIRTTSDLFRILPFSVFVIVPFMELLLPIALKLFPSMLPSTFQTASDRQEKLRRTLKAKLEYAKFLQKTLDEMELKGKGHYSNSAKDFVTFFDRVRSGKELVTNDEIKKFSKLFEDEITLDNMTRGQLSALCRLLELTPFGTSNFLKFQLQMKLRSLTADDRVIQKEGLESLSVQELQLACKERGMRALGLTEPQLRYQLQEWLDLSLSSKVPPSLLLLSRTLYLPETLPLDQQLAATISALPDSAATQAKHALGSKEGKVENVTRLEIIKEEERKIAEERAEQEKLKEEEKFKEDVEKEMQTVKKMIDVLDVEIPDSEGSPTVQRIVQEATKTVEAKPAYVLADRASTLKDDSTEKTTELSSTDIAALEQAIDDVSQQKGDFQVEKEESHSIKKELEDYKEDLEDLETATELLQRKDLKESKGAKRLYNSVNKMLDNIVSSIEKQEASKGEVEPQAQEAKKSITIAEMISSLEKMKRIEDEEKLEEISKILARIDEDRDGAITVDEVKKLVEQFEHDDVELSSKQIEEIIDTVEKEEKLEIEGKIEKSLVKEKRRANEAEEEMAGELESSVGEDDDGVFEKDVAPTMSRSKEDEAKKP